MSYIVVENKIYKKNNDNILTLDNKKITKKELSEVMEINTNKEIQKIESLLKDKNLKKTLYYNDGDISLQNKQLINFLSKVDKLEDINDKLDSLVSKNNYTSSNSIPELFLEDSVWKEIDDLFIGLTCQDILVEDFKVVEKELANQVVINFYGNPGTGKTETAKYLIQKLGMDYEKVDFTKIISKWKGDTSKNIKELFQKAKEENKVLLLDEADALIKQRSAAEKESNLNVFMNELDMHNGIIIMTTNFCDSYDKAMFRRLDYNIEFKDPNEELRVLFFKKYLSDKLKFNSEFSFDILAKKSKGLSGGYILKICKKALISFFNDVSKKYQGNVHQNFTKEAFEMKYVIDEINKIQKEDKSNPIGLVINSN